MLIKEKSGNIKSLSIEGCTIDVVVIEWYEASKRILHKKTKQGSEITIKFLKKNPDLKDGDILWQEKKKIIAVKIKPCKCFVFTPVNILAAPFMCYKIGNRHLPLYYEGDDLLV